jgi:photosystem II stability/assembly factor-like uncharacterized protein
MIITNVVSSRHVLSAAVLAAGLALAGLTNAGAETVPELLARTHIHGLAVEHGGEARLLIATHHGLYAADGDGTVTRLSDHRHDLMGFSPHPDDPSILYASGHPATGGNLGFIASDDGGASWTQLSPGANGPVDFHQMAVSAADPSVMYGVYGDLQRSDDGGRNWEIVGSPPEGLMALAASARDPETLYAATEPGIVVSRDGGQRWEPGHIIAAPATAIHSSRDGKLYVYMIGQGLLTVDEAEFPRWRRAGPELDGDDVILHLAAAPAAPDRVYAATWRGRLLVSEDGGRVWRDAGSH